MEEKQRGYYSMKGKETVSGFCFRKRNMQRQENPLGRTERETSKDRRLRKTRNKPREVMSWRPRKARTVVKRTPKAWETTTGEPRKGQKEKNWAEQTLAGGRGGEDKKAGSPARCADGRTKATTAAVPPSRFYLLRTHGDLLPSPDVYDFISRDDSDADLCLYTSANNLFSETALLQVTFLVLKTHPSDPHKIFLPERRKIKYAKELCGNVQIFKRF